MRIVFDLDGVLRNLSGYLEDNLGVPYPQHWYWKHNNKDIFDFVEEDNFRPLFLSKPTKYVSYVLSQFDNIEIWTNQPSIWVPYTLTWLRNNLRRYDLNYVVAYLNTSEKEQRLYSSKEIFLVEDNPNFKNYDRIILVDEPYNSHINASNRVRNAEELDSFIRSLK